MQGTLRLGVGMRGRGYAPWGSERVAGAHTARRQQTGPATLHAHNPPGAHPRAQEAPSTPRRSCWPGAPRGQAGPGHPATTSCAPPPSRGPSPPRPGSLKGLVNRQLRPRLMQHSEVCTSQWNGRHGSTAQARNLVSRSGTRTPWLSTALTTYRLSGAPSRSTRTRHRPSPHRERRRATIRGSRSDGQWLNRA